MNSRRMLSLLLALVMTFSTFAGVIPVNAFASQADSEPEQTETIAQSQTFDFSTDELGISEDGELVINLPDETEEEVLLEETEEALEPEPAESVQEEAEPEEETLLSEEAEPSEPALLIEEEDSETADQVASGEPLTWFQWIAEQGVDTSSLSKEELLDLNCQYSDYRRSVLFPSGEQPEGAAGGMVGNDYLEISVADNGRFTIGNREGNPDFTSDNNKILLFGHPHPGTSETLIVIDGGYSNFFFADSISYTYNTATATMYVPSYGIQVVQTLQLVKSGSVGFEDTVHIQYRVVNNSGAAHDVGVRIMMDTMLAYNDHAPFRVASVGNITSARVFTGSDIPNMYQVYDNLDNPTTLATGYLYRGFDRKPDKVQFCNWGGIVGSDWNHTVYDGDYLGDSAVGIYFDPVTINPGKSTTVSTYYGVSVGSGSGSSEEIADNKTKVSVRDSQTGVALENVLVECLADGQVVQSEYTNTSGYVLLDSRDSGNIRLRLSLEGYKTAQFATWLRPGASLSHVMSRENSNKPIVNTVVLENGTTCVNLLNGSATFTEDANGDIDGQGATGTVTIKATSDTENCTWLLVEDEKVLQRNTTGEFPLNILKTDTITLIEQLSPGGNIYVQCVSPEGKKSDKMRLGLRVRAKTKDLEFFPLSMGELLPSGTSRLADGTLAALFLGNQFEFGPSSNENLKFQVSLEDDGTVRVGLNFTAKEWEKLTDNAKKANKTQDDIKKDLAKAMKDFAKGKNGKFSKLFDRSMKFKYSTVKADFAIGGYGEGKLENGSVRIDLTVYAALKGELSHTTQFLVYTIPVYVQVGGEAEGKVQASANLVNSEGVQFALYDGAFEPSLKVWLEGGVGVKGAVSVGAQGSGTVTLTCDFIPWSQRATLLAQATLVAEVLLWSKELPLAQQEWVLFDSNGSNGEVYGGDENVFEMLAEQPFKLVTRDQSGESADRGGAEASAQEVRLLNVNGTQYKFFLADRGGNNSNRFMLSYSKLVGGSWTEAVPVWDDGTTDTYFHVATDGGRIYVVWGNSNTTFDDKTVTVDQMYAAQDICFTTIGPDGSIAEPVYLIQDDVMDIMPAVTVVNGTAYVAWYHTQNGIENDVDTYDNFLYYTAITGNTVGEIQSINCGNGSISSIVAAPIGGVPVATYVTNASTEVTFADNVTNQVVMSSGENSVIDTTDKTIGKAVNAVLDGKNQVFWMEDGNVAYADSMTAEKPSYVFAQEEIPGSISYDNYTVINAGETAYLVWTQGSGAENEPSSAMTSVYSGGVWSKAHKLAALSIGNISNLDGYLNSDGDLVLVYSVRNGQVTTSVEKVVTPEKTVRIADISFDKADAAPGRELPVTISLVNTGNTTIDTLNISINSDAGENFTRQLTNLGLEPASSTDVTVEGFVLSSSLTTRTAGQSEYLYTVTANAEGSAVAASDTFELGNDNVYVSKQDLVVVDNREKMVLEIGNHSGFPASNVRVKVLADAVDGVVLYNNTFDTLAANSRTTVYLDVEDLSSRSLFASIRSDCTPEKVTELILSNPVTEAVLTVKADGCGTVTPAAPVDVSVGEGVQITAIPNPGYLFDGWYSHRELTFLYGDENTANAQIEMPAGDTTITARFVSAQAYDFTLDSTSREINSGEQFQLNAVFASAEETGKVTWRSENDTIASVTDRGLVIGLMEGTTQIVASCAEYQHTCQVTVRSVDVTEIRMVYPEMNLVLDEKAAIEVVTAPENGRGSLLWHSSNEDAVLVDSLGRVIAVGYGEAVITATAMSDPQVTAQCIVRVTLPVEEIGLDATELTVNQGGSAELHVQYFPDNANIGKEVTWIVENNSDVVSLEWSGEFNETVTITGNRVGIATVTAQTEGGLTESCTVTVRDTVYASSVEEMQSSHNPYEANVNKCWIYTDESAEMLVLTFSEETALAPDDSITILDGQGQPLGTFYGDALAGYQIAVLDNTAVVNLVSGDNTDYYGFRVQEIRNQITAEDLSVSIENQEYTGKPVTPEITVFCVGQTLTCDEDYTVTFSNNKNIGTATATITGCGRFEGITLKKTFQICPSNTELSGNVNSRGIVLSWAVSKGAGGYDLFRSMDGEEYTRYKTLGAVKTFTDTSVSGEHVYSYKLVPFKKVGSGKNIVVYSAPESEFGPITKLGPATGLTAAVEQQEIPYKVTLSWNAVAGADGYYIYRTDSEGGFVRYDTTAETTFTCQNIWDVGIVRFWVVPYKYLNEEPYEGGASAAVATCVMYAPYLNCHQDRSGVRLFYSFPEDLPGVAGIELYRSVNGGRETKIQTIKLGQGVSYGELLDNRATASGSYYTYRARLYAVDGRTTFYSPFSSETKILSLSAPQITAVKPAENGMSVTWRPVAGAESYEIHRYYYDPVSDGDNEELFTFTPEKPGREYTYVDTDTDSMGYYSYAVVARADRDGDEYRSSYSTRLSGYVLDAPELEHVGNAQKGTTLSWNWAHYASGYEVWRSTDDGANWSKLRNTSDCWLNDTSAVRSGTTYSYRIRAYHQEGRTIFYSPFSEFQSIMALSQPQITGIRQTETGGMEITWRQVPGAQSYQIQCYLYEYGEESEGVARENIYNVSDSARTYTFEDTNTDSSGYYVYSVAACSQADGNGSVSAYSLQKTGVVLETPELRSLTNSARGTDLDWSWDDYASGYEVWRSTDGGQRWSRLRSLNTNYLNDTTASRNGLTYTYKVRSYAREGGVTFYSPFGDERSISKMTPPAIKKVMAVSDGGFEITFGAVADATSYYLYRYSTREDDEGTYLTNYSSDGQKTFTYCDKDACEENVLYWYEVKACRETDDDRKSSASSWAAVYHFGQPELTVENVGKGIMLRSLVRDVDGYGYARQYNIYRSVNGGAFRKLKTVAADANGRLNWLDTGVRVNTVYDYRVEAINPYMYAYTTRQSEPASIRYGIAPVISAATNLINGICVTWKAQRNMPAAERYEIYRSTDDFTFQQVGTADADTYTFVDTEQLENDQMYYYRVKLIPADSNDVAACTASSLICRVGTPTNVEVWRIDGRNANIFWDYNGITGGAQVRYVNGRTSKIVTTRYQGYCPLAGLNAMLEYEVSVRTYRKVGRVTYYSDWSEPITLGAYQ